MSKASNKFFSRRNNATKHSVDEYDDISIQYPNKQTASATSLSLDTTMGEESRHPSPISPNSKKISYTFFGRSSSTEAESSPNKPTLAQKPIVNRLFSSMNILRNHDSTQQNLIDATKEYQKSLEKSLEFILEDMKGETLNAASCGNLGIVYMKLARLNDINKQTDNADDNRAKAVSSFDEAISLSQDQSDLILYKTYKAKCLYHMGRLDEAELLSENPTTGLAYENLGYIYTLRGQYAQALESFELSLKANPEYKKSHKILSYYNQAVLLATLGRKEEALTRFETANKKKIPVDIDEEDRILINEIRTKSYHEHITKLAELAHSGSRVRNLSEGSYSDNTTGEVEQQRAIKAVAVAILPGTKIQMDAVPQNLESLSKTVTTRQQAASKETKPHLNNLQKLQEKINIIQQNTNNTDIDLSSQKQMIESDPRLQHFSSEIQLVLKASYHACLVISSDEIEGKNAGAAGWGAWIISMVSDNAPPLIKLGFSLIAGVLQVVDDANKVARATQFIRDVGSQMDSLAEEIAISLTLLRKKHLETPEDATDNTLPASSAHKSWFNTKPKSIKDESILDGNKIGKFILGLIFDGRIKDVAETQKVATILGYIALNDEYYSNLPEDSTNIASEALTHMKTEYSNKKILWKSETEIEGKFTRSVAFNIPLNILIKEDHTPMGLSLSEHLSSEVLVTRRTSKLWEKKAKLKTDFQKDLSYFSPHVKKALEAIKPTYSSSSTSPLARQSSDDSNDSNNTVTTQHLHSHEEDKNTAAVTLGGEDQGYAEDLGF